MVKIIPNALIESMSGKVCGHSDEYFATNKQTGETYAAKLCNPSDKPATTAQRTHRTSFAQQSQRVSEWLASNKPSSTNPNGTADYQKALKAYKSQHKIGNFFAFLYKVLTSTGTIDLTRLQQATAVSGGTGTGSGTGGSGTGSGGTQQQGGGGNSGNMPAGNVTITLTSADATQGKVQINIGEVGNTATATVQSGAATVIKAIPEAGYTFSKWSDGGLQFERTINPTEDVSLTATFEAE